MKQTKNGRYLVVIDAYFECFRRLAVLEHQFTLAALEILAAGCGHVLSLPLELDSAVAAVAALDGDESLARALLDDQARLAELECARVCNSTQQRHSVQ